MTLRNYLTRSEVENLLACASRDSYHPERNHCMLLMAFMVRKLNHRFKIFLTMNFISLWGLIARDRGIYGEKMLFSAYF
ncbi:TPA: hypothetical protein ACTDNW_003014 [Salmonella enterica subsp. enterica serovar Lexington]